MFEIMDRRNFQRNFLLDLSKSAFNYFDAQLICRDGVVPWSKFLLAANSPFLRKELESVTEDVAIYVKSLSASTVSTLLNCTLNYNVRSDVLSVNELEVVKLLGFSLPEKEEKDESSPQPSSLSNLISLDLRFEEEDTSSSSTYSPKAHYSSENPSSDEDSKFRCRFCDKSFNRKDNLKEHVRRRHGVFPADFKCSDCDAGFSRAQHLEEHIASAHRRDESYACQLCGKIFYHLTYLKQHEAYHENKSQLYKCESCDKEFNGRRALGNHRDRFHVKFNCFECGVQVPKAIYKRHLIRLHGVKGDKEIPCAKCDRTFDTVRSLTLHTRIHDEKIPRALRDESSSCPKCQKDFPSKKRLRAHIKSVHDSDKSHCQLCSKSVKSLSSHLKAMHEDTKEYSKKRETSCGECGKTFSTPYSAKYHYNKNHLKTNKTKEECGICGKSYEFLKRHIREVHSENRHECDICGKFFPVRYSLERHIRNVHRTRRLECPECKLEVIHLAMHLMGTHKFSSQDSRDIVKRLTSSENLINLQNYEAPLS